MLLMAVISLARAVTTAIMTAMIEALGGKLIERSLAPAATIPVTRPMMADR
ncbi:hypothetical protein [Candidatus Chloroploca sp. Khr17]|uniref:hypothetical protein n=1 Tax=Candidatus Chloroploca sp. Khr17 TaxID=2496869 RepID=UPI0013EA1390|nr:hypothetical protein [Candidatus Chloroploca sp. Khr17]